MMVMKIARNIPVKFVLDSLKHPSGVAVSQSKASSRMWVWLILFISATYLVYTFKLLSSSHAAACQEQIIFTSSRYNDNVALPEPTNYTIPEPTNFTVAIPSIKSVQDKTGLEHIVFGIGASSKLWSKRKEYIKLWWKPENRMRGIVWLDKKVITYKSEAGKLPELRVSADISRFPYKNKQGRRSGIRISRIVSETLRLGNMDNVRWFVMGDDDTVFVTENLVRVLNKYDHNQYYYIGSLSESHLQNIYFSSGMAYGGGGFAISYPLAKLLEKMQDRCIQRYPGLYGSDDRMQACMAELGVPLTKELGFHQYDVYGNLFGLLAAHPVTPLVTLHHLDVVEPIFPNMTQLQALKKLKIPEQLDSAGLMQQSICYDKSNSWSISVSWGFAVQILRGHFSPRELEMPSRTFLNWYKREDYRMYAFNTRPVARNPCQKPFVYYFSKAKLESDTNETMSEYIRHDVPHPVCKWKMPDPVEVERVHVYKKPDPHLWNRSPRRNCCRVLSSNRKNLVIDVGLCEEKEIIEVS